MREFFLYLKTRNLSDKTIKLIISRVSNILNIVFPLTQDNYITFHADILKQHSASTANKYKQAIDHYCDFKHIGRFDIPRLKEKRKPKVVLSLDEIEDILESKEDNYTQFIHILAYTGMRPGEVFNLTQNDIDSHNQVLMVQTSKTGDGRIVPYQNTNNITPPFLFSDTALNKNIKLRCEIVGIIKTVTAYTFRHSYITRMLAEGVPLFIVQQLVGHSKADTTAQYFHSDIKMLREASLLDPLSKKNISSEQIVEQAEKQLLKQIGSRITNRATYQRAISLLYEAIT